MFSERQNAVSLTALLEKAERRASFVFFSLSLPFTHLSGGNTFYEIMASCKLLYITSNN
jgi:hypothetical protein